MRKTLSALSALAFAIVMAGPASAASTLKAAHYVSPKHPIGVGYTSFAKEVEARTDGQLKVRVFAGGSLLGAKALSDGVRDQVADVGFIVYANTPAYYPYAVLLNDLAMLGENDMAGLFAVTELFSQHCEPCQAEAFRQNQVFLTGISTTAYGLIARTDVNSAEKIRGKKLRVAGSLWDRFASSVGATGVNVPTAEMFEALSRGTIDGAIYAVGGLKSHSLADVASSVVLLNLGSVRSGSMFSLNRDVWTSFTPEQRTAVYKAAAKGVVTTTRAYIQADEEALELAKEKKLPIEQPDESLIKARAAFVQADEAVVIRNAKEKLGIENPEAFIEKYKELLAKYEALVPPIETDTDQLAELMYNEILARLAPDYGVK